MCKEHHMPRPKVSENIGFIEQKVRHGYIIWCSVGVVVEEKVRKSDKVEGCPGLDHKKSSQL